MQAGASGWAVQAAGGPALWESCALSQVWAQPGPLGREQVCVCEPWTEGLSGQGAFPRGTARLGRGCGSWEGGGCGVPVGPCAAGAPGGGEPCGPQGAPAASIVTATPPSACLCVSICARAHVAHAAPASIARAAPSPERTAPALLLALSRLASGTELTHAAPPVWLLLPTAGAPPRCCAVFGECVSDMCGFYPGSSQTHRSPSLPAPPACLAGP